MAKHFPCIASRAEQASSKFFFRTKDEYEEKLLKLQYKLVALQQRLHQKEKKIIIILEGRDAAGKGGVIKRLTRHLDPRGFRVHSIGKPNAFEERQHYLERFFVKLPAPGTISVFDRSWYGRVLVERVDELCSKAEWSRAFDEINCIEKMLVDDKVLVLKYLLDLSHDEQKLRFKEREKDPIKSWKLNSEDWHNRKMWNRYQIAYREMLVKCSPPSAPWKLIAADSKWFCRVSILTDIASRTQKFLS